MARVKVVTGYIPLKDHPIAIQDYWAYGDKLLRNLACRTSMDNTTTTVEDTWLYSWLEHSDRLNMSHSVADNPAKNTLAFHCVQHEKFRWLQRAARTDDENSEILVWIDYGILHVPGVTIEVIQNYLERLTPTDIQIPGCWQRDEHINQLYPCWRFCGGVLAVPIDLVEYFSQLCRVVAMEHIMKTCNVEWEVNTLARVELTNKLPIRWYQADHNQTMFTNLP